MKRAADVDAGTVQHMCVNHCGRDVLVTEQFLHSANIIAILHRMCSETVPPRKSYAHAVGLIGLFFRYLQAELLEIVSPGPLFN